VRDGRLGSFVRIDHVVSERSRLPFIVAYSGRVGSTALIDTLKAIPGFTVPLFEELDRDSMQRAGLLAQWNEATIADYAGRFLRPPPDQPGSSAGFKWRIWGDVAPLAAMLREEGVVAFNLVRSDLLEYTASRYLSDIHYRDFNAPQFRAAYAKTEAERAAVRERYRTTVVAVEAERLLELAEAILADEQRRYAYLLELQAAGVPVLTVFYEDFAYRRYRFVNAMIARLGHPPIASIPTITLGKVSSPYPSELLSNRAEIVASPRLIAALGTWDAMMYAGGLPLLDLDRHTTKPTATVAAIPPPLPSAPEPQEEDPAEALVGELRRVLGRREMSWPELLRRVSGLETSLFQYWYNQFDRGAEISAVDAVPVIQRLYFSNPAGRVIRALDVGAHTGGGAAMLARLHSRSGPSHLKLDVTALEMPDPRLAAYARAVHPELRLIFADVFAHRETYDLVFSANTVMTVAEPIAYVRRLQALARDYVLCLAPFAETDRIPSHRTTIDTAFLAQLDPIEVNIYTNVGWKTRGQYVAFVVKGRAPRA
jgi:hypothetical protein